MLPRDSIPLSQVARTAAALPVADPRQQAFQRAFAGMVGQSMQAEVLAKLPDGSFVVRVNDTAARMPLPANAQVGSQVALTLVAVAPRPTFQVGSGAPAFAEAGPAPGEGAHAGAQAPLAYLEGKDAAALVRTSALLAQTRNVAGLGNGAASDANTSISTAGKALGDIIATAQKADTPATAALGRTPLLGAASLDAASIARALQDGMGKSGLFYESHVAEWAQGARSMGDLAAEPQAQGRMPSPADPATAQFINMQLTAHEQARVAWQGQLWPGQEMRWEVERDPAERDASAGAGDDDAGGTWQSRLMLRFGALGEVAARVVLSGDQLHIRLDAASEEAGQRMQAQRARLEQALDAAGMPLSTLAIHAVPAPLPVAESGAESGADHG
jgi:hypothetical protein